MKDENLRKLFKEVDKSEDTSIEFETVWRKANRRGWKDKYFHSLRHNLAILCTLLILAPVVGSFIVSNPQSDKDADFYENHDVIQGQTRRLADKAVIKGQSSLPEGSIIQLKLIKIESETIIDEKEIQIDRAGSFIGTFHVPDKQEDYIVMLELFPHLQSKSIQEVIGPKGENLYSSPQVNGVYHYLIEKELYTGIRLYGDAAKGNLNANKMMFGSLKSNMP
ncbi:hypothetical protein ACOJQI_13115 [Bacillus salacetis]|uniref:hypothetical protein n=1 Tax=Bacillus salacetis TaxID=2315464 RepID=UPI003BA0AF3C